jgi:hypothetical protein
LHCGNSNIDHIVTVIVIEFCFGIHRLAQMSALSLACISAVMELTSLPPRPFGTEQASINLMPRAGDVVSFNRRIDENGYKMS